MAYISCGAASNKHVGSKSMVRPDGGPDLAQLQEQAGLISCDARRAVKPLRSMLASGQAEFPQADWQSGSVR